MSQAQMRTQSGEEQRPEAVAALPQSGQRPRRHRWGRILAMTFVALFALVVLFVWQGVQALDAMARTVQGAASGISGESQSLRVVAERLTAIQGALQAIGQAIAHLVRLITG